MKKASELWTKKLNKEIIIRHHPTAQVRLLCCELLNDGKVHTRKELINYVNSKGNEWGLEPFSEGCLTGGLRQAVINMKCEKLGSGIYQAPLKNSMDELSLPKKVAEICDSYIDRISEISREIDYIEADENEIEMLIKLKNFVIDLKKWKDTFENIDS